MKPFLYLVLAGALGGSAALAYSQLAGDDRTRVASVDILDAPNAVSDAADAQIIAADGAETDLANLTASEPLDPAKLTPGDQNIATSTATPRLCNGELSPIAPTPDGRLFGHYPYAEASSASLSAPPAGLGGGNCQFVHRDALPDLQAMIKAAKADGVTLTGLSCFRSVSYQRGVFCNSAKLAAQGGIAGRAKSSAPPGYSEHATGYTIDFGDQSAPGANLEARFANTKAGKWLAANARSYSFEMSFPAGSKQGVTYEPWHFRWIGNGAATSTFATARASFPGR